MLEQPNQPIKMKHIIAKNTLSFMTSKSYKFVRTPLDIWESLTKEFAFTLDACASNTNHLIQKYYTRENSCLDKDWTGEVVYCHLSRQKSISKRGQCGI